MLTDRIVAAVRRAIGPADELVLLHRPYLPPTVSKYVQECLDTGWVSSAGGFVTRFEQELARYTGARRAVVTVNGTAALQVCLHLAGVRPGDEVLCPSLTFVATANAISHCGAMPHFIDVAADRLAICPVALAERLQSIAVMGDEGAVNRETGRPLRAVCLMHCLGHPANINRIAELCRQYGIALVEDAAESLGSYYNGTHTGRFGALAAVSFNGNKILTTGGGGAILTDDEELGERAKHLTTTAKVAHPWEFHHDAVAWNYRMPNINAAMGVAQLEVLPAMLDAKRRVAERYAAELESVAEVSFITEPSDSRSNYWLNGFVLDSRHASARDDILRALNEAGYQSRPLWQPMHALPMYAACPRGPLDATESLCARIINIPSSADLAENWPSNP